MKVFKVIVIALVALIAMDAIYVGYSQTAADSSAYMAQDDTSADE